jgi:hypothetical protein
MLCLDVSKSISLSLILLGTGPHPKKARNTRDIKNGGVRFECVNYCLLRRNNTPSENNMKHSPRTHNANEKWRWERAFVVLS